MPHRTSPPERPVHFEHDGERLLANQGESLCSALLAADRVLLARSPKLHRPRGPYCLRGGCDGCLARVDGVPNVMTCLTEARGGERVETQNVFGTRKLDLMAATDFLFPKGIDHHKLFAGVRGVSNVVQRFARRVAGLGELPASVGEVRPARRERVDTLIVGSGRRACRAAREARATGDEVVMVDDALQPGGRGRLLDPGALDAASLQTVRCQTTVISLSREPAPSLWALAAGPEGVTLFEATRIVLATGRHDPVMAFGNNDLPGIFSARAALQLAREGISVGRRVGVVGQGRLSDALTATAPAEWIRVDPSELLRATGRQRVTGAVLAQEGKERRLALDALVIEGAGAPAFELAVQAGATVRHTPDGFEPVLNDQAFAAPDVRCVGSLASVLE